jgi:hypothetical protein
VSYTLNQTFSLPGAFSFDSTARSPDLLVRSFGYQSPSSMMCVDVYDPGQNPSGFYASTSWQCSHSGDATHNMNCILYDWALQSFL